MKFKRGDLVKLNIWLIEPDLIIYVEKVFMYNNVTYIQYDSVQFYPTSYCRLISSILREENGV